VRGFDDDGSSKTPLLPKKRRSALPLDVVVSCFSPYKGLRKVMACILDSSPLWLDLSCGAVWYQYWYISIWYVPVCMLVLYGVHDHTGLSGAKM